MVGAVDRLIAEGGGNAARTGVCGIQSDRIFLQCRRRYKDLKNGAGLIRITDRPVTPLAVQGLPLRLAPLGLILNGIQLCLNRGIGHYARLIEIIVGQGGHGENGAGIHIHHDAIGTFRLRVNIRLFQALLQIVLNHPVDCQNKAVPLLGIIRGLILIGHIVLCAVFSRDNATGRAGQLLVILKLQAGAALVIRSGESNDRGGKIIVWIIPLGIRIKPDDGVERLILSVLVDKGGQRIFGIVFDPFLDRHIVILAL